MKRRARRSVARLMLSGVALAVAGAGCSLIVSGEPEIRCTPGATAACPNGMLCAASGRCVSSEASIEPVEGGEEDVVDEEIREGGREADVTTGPQDLGAQCRVDSDCKSKLCATSTVLTPVITQKTGPICTTPCCTSSDCAPSFVCFNGGTGGSYCVPATLAQRTPPASGGKGPGAACAASTECRSGVCTAPSGSPKRCLDTCCSDTQCQAGSVCRLQAVSAPPPAHDIWVCAAAEPGATGAVGDSCGSSTPSPPACKSDLCLPSSTGYCRPPCSGHATCVAVPGFTNGLCRYGQSGSDFFKHCQQTTPQGKANGMACTNDTECTYDYCDPELKRCANVCSTNSDCISSEVCRPSGSGTPFLRCVPKT